MVTDIADRLLDLERRVAALEERTMPCSITLTVDADRLSEALRAAIHDAIRDMREGDLR